MQSDVHVRNFKMQKKSTNLFDGIRKNSIVDTDCILLLWAKFHDILHFCFFFLIIIYLILQVVSTGQKSSLRAQAHCLLVPVIASVQVLSHMQG